jgi:hypothetical protein
MVYRFQLREAGNDFLEKPVFGGDSHMRGTRGPIGLLALTAAFLVLAFGASSAQAEFGIAKWESPTCKTDESEVGAGNWEANGDPCLSTDEESRFFTQAAAHPNFGITAFLMNQKGGFPNLPDGFLKQTRVELPEGLGVNPQATEQCTVQKLSEVIATEPIVLTKCFLTKSQVGWDYLTTISPGPPPVTLPPAGVEFTLKTPVYNIETPDDPSSPFFGASSLAGFNVTGEPTFLVGDLDPKDQHISFTIHDIESPLEGGPPIIGSRLVFERKVGSEENGFVTLPSECAGPQRTILDVLSHPYPIPPGPELERSAIFDTPYSATGCDEVPFNPEVEVTVDSKTDSPEPATVDVRIPFISDPTKITESQLRVAKVVLPEGAGLNPSVANGLVPCTDAQFAKGTNDPITCPGSSKIGSVEVETPSLPPGSVGGEVFVAQPLNNNASSGEQFRIFLHVTSVRFGVDVRLVGEIFPNLQTGQITALVDENPQAPFESFKVHIDGGPRGALTTPDTCGPHTTTSQLTPWSQNPPVKEPEPSSFNLTEAAGGGPCPKTLAERPFSPTFTAGTVSNKAGKFSPFELHITRPDGAQEIRRVDVNLPPGMVAKLKGLEYCPEASIAAAGTRSGASTIANPPCPDKSFVGTSDTAVGSGPAPFHTPGNAYLAGPYKGAPISMLFVTPAVAGPYDLGTVAVRVALNIDPETAEVHAVSDPIPFIFGGVKLDIRSIDVSINRKNFTLNPTTCREPFQIAAGIFGGGGNPADPASWFEAKASSSFRASNCKALNFQPKFFARILGGENQTKRAKNPKFRAILEARNGDANVRRAAFILPRATILDQSHIKTICTRVQLAANNCPKNAIYGHAKATSPLLNGKLKGPVYLTSSNHTLPDLLVDLHGQVPIRLRGVISSEHGRLKTVFNNTPDVAVNKFILTMKGNEKGLLINSRDLCSRQTNGFLNLRAQNSRRLKRNNLRLNIPAC